MINPVNESESLQYSLLKSIQCFFYPTLAYTVVNSKQSLQKNKHLSRGIKCFQIKYTFIIFQFVSVETSRKFYKFKIKNILWKKPNVGHI